MRHLRDALMMAAVLVFVVTPVWAGEPEQIVLGAHYGFSGTISKIQSGVLFVNTDTGLQPRTISPNKADRVGLYDAKVGDMVNMLVDSGNVLIDVAKTDQFFPDHHFVAGTFHYADAYWGEVQVSTPEGPTHFEVDPMAGSKLSLLQEGTPVTIELDADNVMIDIYRSR